MVRVTQVFVSAEPRHLFLAHIASYHTTQSKANRRDFYNHFIINLFLNSNLFLACPYASSSTLSLLDLPTSLFILPPDFFPTRLLSNLQLFAFLHYHPHVTMSAAATTIRHPMGSHVTRNLDLLTYFPLVAFPVLFLMVGNWT